MTVKLSAEMQGALTKACGDLVGDAAKIAQAEVKAAGLGLRDELRAQVSATLGRRLAQTWTMRVYPQTGASLGAAALVWSRAPDIAEAHDEGKVIRSSRGLWLAIPLPAAGKGKRGKRPTVGEWQKIHGMRLRFIYRKGKPGLLVADNARLTGSGRARANIGRSKKAAGVYTRIQGRTTVPIFLLVPQVKLRKRTNYAQAAEKWQGKLHAAVSGKLGA